MSRCISEYRKTKPNLILPDDTKKVFERIKDKRKYLVTDGNKLVQYNKIEALSLIKVFEKFFITHRYGLKCAKPSIYCFELIKNLENVEWEDLVYIGDNPRKDFIGLNNKGALTVQICSSPYFTEEVPKAYKARLKFGCLSKAVSYLLKHHSFA